MLSFVYLSLSIILIRGYKGTKSLGDKRGLSQKNTFLKEKEDILIHPTMTVMTDDSFLNLRGKEALVNIYYNIYNTNL